MGVDGMMHGPGTWRIRRRFMFAITAFCMLVIFYALYTRMDTKPAEAAVTTARLPLRRSPIPNSLVLRHAAVACRLS